MKEFDFMQARKELQEKLGKSYIVTVYLYGEKRLSVRSKSAILNMECIGIIFWYCKIHHLKYYVYIASAASPAFDIFQ